MASIEALLTLEPPTNSEPYLGDAVGGSEPIDDFALPIDQEFGEVPFDCLGAEKSWCSGLEVFVERMGVGPIDIAFREHGKGDIEVAGAELGNVLVGTGLLSAKLITRKAHHHQTAVLVLEIQVFQVPVLRGKAALTGDIDDQQHFPLIVQQILWTPIEPA